MSAVETHAFQAEVSQVLSLVINSLYSHREIFVRELISNASDALDKLKYRSLTEHDLVSDEVPREIRLITDSEAGTLTIEDFGIGMSHDDLVDHLGTVARSGTQAFAKALEEAGKESGGAGVGLIGQFGVGFYSAYLVADRVEVVSRAVDGESAWRWVSDGKQGFTVEPAERDQPGSAVILHLKEDQREFVDEWRLRDLVRRYSDYVSWPIKLQVTRSEVAEGADEEDGEPTTRTEFEQINQGKALWQRSKGEVEAEEYEAFYKHISHDWEDPLTHSHFKVEGTQLFTGLLFVPKRAPFDLFSRDHRRGVRLYVKRVFIMDDVEELVPTWLRFLRGVIDSDDLPLNVSRELLQDSKTVRFIKKQLVKKALSMLEALASDSPDDYATLWEQFGLVLKEGLHLATDDSKKRLADLARFRSSHGEGWHSLSDYVERMPEDQKAIYYAIGDTVAAAASSPHLEALRKRGYEVFYLTDPIDDWAARGIGSYADKDLVSAMHADLGLEDADADDAAEDKDDREKAADEQGLEALLGYIGEVLGERVADVRLSKRLTDSPVCLVVPEGGMHASMERLLRAHEPGLAATKRIFEVNAEHVLVKQMRQVHEAQPDAEQLKDWVELLYDQALLTEGSPIPEPALFAQRLSMLLTHAATSLSSSVGAG